MPREMILPAVGQGALGWKRRGTTLQTITALAPLNDLASHAAVLASAQCSPPYAADAWPRRWMGTL